MKRIKYYLAALVTSALLLNSCSESFFDINVSPNDPADATPALVLPSALSGTAYVMGGYYHALGSYWSQQYAQSPAASQWGELESYNLTEDDFDRQFRDLYAGALTDYQFVRNKSAATQNWSYYAISTLMQAYTFQVLADLYDKVPFTEALKGVEIPQPRYDDGALIYDSLLARIDNAMAKDFDLSSVEDATNSDLILAGDMTEWVKFANTLKLKIYMRYVNINPTKYQTQIQALLAENNFLTKDAKFTAFKAEQTGYNPFFNTFVDRLASNVVANTTLMNFIVENGDPRKNKLFTASATGGLYTSVATGTSPDITGNTIKNYATPTMPNTGPVYFFSKEEVLFLVAEAQFRYGSAVTAEATYKSGIEASLVSLGLAANAITYPYTGLQSIMEQKWVAATNKRAIEAFFDYTRTGYPRFLTESPTSVIARIDDPVLEFNDELYKAYPKRLFFPNSERKTNANTPAKVALSVPVWWAQVK